MLTKGLGSGLQLDLGAGSGRDGLRGLLVALLVAHCTGDRRRLLGLHGGGLRGLEARDTAGDARGDLASRGHGGRGQGSGLSHRGGTLVESGLSGGTVAADGLLLSHSDGADGALNSGGGGVGRLVLGDHFALDPLDLDLGARSDGGTDLSRGV